MRNLFYSRQAKIFVDILLILGFVIAITFSRLEYPTEIYWKSPHCIIGTVWFLLIIVHATQNWKMIKACTKKKVIIKNKITVFTILTFVLMFISIFCFVFGSGIISLKFHKVIGHLFIIALIIHSVDKYRRFIAFCRKHK